MTNKRIHKSGLENLLDSSKPANSFRYLARKTLPFFLSLSTLACAPKTVTTDQSCPTPCYSDDDQDTEDPTENPEITETAELNGVIEKYGRTNSLGQVNFTDQQTREDVLITVTDNSNNQPLTNVDVTFLDSNQFEAFITYKEDYMPQMRIFPHNSEHRFSLTPAAIAPSFELFTYQDEEAIPAQNLLDWSKGSCTYQGCHNYEDLQSTNNIFNYLLMFLEKVFFYNTLEKLVNYGDDIGLTENDPREFAYYRYYCAPRAGDNLFAAFMVYEPRFTGLVEDVCAESTPCTITETNRLCQDNEIHETDNCSNNRLIQDCATTEQICQEAACIDEEPECTLEAEVRCFDGNARWVDSCGTWGDIADYCTTAEHCEEGTGCTPNEIEEICNPIQDCPDAGCILYDNFSSGVLEDCRWWVDYGLSDIYGGVLYLTEGASLYGTMGAAEEACPIDYIKYRTRLDSSIGRFMLQIHKDSGIDNIKFNGAEHPNQLGFACNPDNPADFLYIDDFNPAAWNEIKVQYEGGNINLYLNEEFKGSRPCSDLSSRIFIFDLSQASDQELQIDEAKIVCKE
ncbi:hypothetical protein J4437_03130 [Candidatus Woesearchaeota archaeon]|nr:hypothetical protein [Candidatus Woesearchaeota archaeon]